jgi:DNA mismatch endonuclease (patch repair protein)
MADWLTRKQRSYNMASIRSRGNQATEEALRTLLRTSNISGWRRHPPLPGKPDFVFRQQRVAVFVDGCFWHGCPRCYRLPEDNRPYWRKKVQGNEARDRAKSRILRKRGWRVIRIWEHSLATSRGRGAVVRRLIRALT